MKNLLIIVFILAAFPLFSEEKNAIGYYNQGKVAENIGDYYTAIEMYKTSLSLNKNYFESISGLAHSYYNLGEYQEALKYVVNAEKLDDLNTDILNLKGRIFLSLEDYVLAEEIFNDVLSIEENNIEAEFGLAELDIASGRIMNASSRYKNALLVSPESRKALLALVLINDANGKTVLAEKYLRQALQYYSDNAYVRYIAAKHFYMTDNLDEALYHLKTALFLQSDFLDASILLSRIYMTEGKYAETVAEIEKILVSKEDEFLLWYLLALAYEKLGEYEKSVMGYARALSVRPDEDLSRIALENQIIKNYPMDSAVRTVYSEYHRDLGRKYEERNMLEKSVYEYRRALVIAPYSVEGRLLYADVFKRMNNIERYLLILSNLVEEGHGTTDILDEIEIRRSMLDRTISEKWNINQFTIDKEINRIALFFNDSGMNHYDGEVILSEYINYLFMAYENVKINHIGISEDFADSFRAAREKKSDYFISFSIAENNRVVSITADIYLSSTGSLLKNIHIIKTGNQMIPEACRAAASEIHGFFPVFGTIINRRFDEVLINLGTKEGLKAEDKLKIIRKGSVVRAKDEFSFKYDAESILGYLEITSADELVSEGLVTVNGFFDMINPGDITLVYLEEDPAEVPQNTQDEQLFISGDLFNSIANIR
ncbi:MAG: tetratricopeptide repeat protein [Spirochaetales bacterium]|nr:tetratricopeptide repeat protein [Spirochaetales bacterium]